MFLYVNAKCLIIFCCFIVLQNLSEMKGFLVSAKNEMHKEIESLELLLF